MYSIEDGVIKVKRINLLRPKEPKIFTLGELKVISYRYRQMQYGIPKHISVCNGTGLSKNGVYKIHIALKSKNLLNNDFSVNLEALNFHFKKTGEIFNYLIHYVPFDRLFTPNEGYVYSYFLNCHRTKFTPPTGWSVTYIANGLGLKRQEVAKILNSLQSKKLITWDKEIIKVKHISQEGMDSFWQTETKPAFEHAGLDTWNDPKRDTKRTLNSQKGILNGHQRDTKRTPPQNTKNAVKYNNSNTLQGKSEKVKGIQNGHNKLCNNLNNYSNKHTSLRECPADSPEAIAGITTPPPLIHNSKFQKLSRETPQEDDFDLAAFLEESVV